MRAHSHKSEGACVSLKREANIFSTCAWDLVNSSCDVVSGPLDIVTLTLCLTQPDKCLTPQFTPQTQTHKHTCAHTLTKVGSTVQLVLDFPWYFQPWPLVHHTTTESLKHDLLWDVINNVSWCLTRKIWYYEWNAWLLPDESGHFSQHWLGIKGSRPPSKAIMRKRLSLLYWAFQPPNRSCNLSLPAWDTMREVV